MAYRISKKSSQCCHQHHNYRRPTWRQQQDIDMTLSSALTQRRLLIAFILGLCSHHVIATSHATPNSCWTACAGPMPAMALPRRRADNRKIRQNSLDSDSSCPAGGIRSNIKTRRNFRNGAEPDPENSDMIHRTPRRTTSTTHQQRQHQQRRKIRIRKKGRCYSGGLFRHDLILPPLDVSASLCDDSSSSSLSWNDALVADSDSQQPTTMRGLHQENRTYVLSSFPAQQHNALPYNQHQQSLIVPSPREEDRLPLEVVYTNDPKMVGKWCSDHISGSGGRNGQEGAALGFDVESVPSAYWQRKDRLRFEGPATVQLSTPTSCIVAHLTRDWGKRRSTCCRPIEALLKDETIIKVGADIDNDMLELYRWNRRLEARSRFDIGGVGSDASRGAPRVGLKKLARAVVGVEMNKSRKLALSNWSRVPLSYDRLAYCARDAWAGAAVMRELARRRPDTFGYDAVLELLEGERSMKELDRRARKRKHAKRTISEIMRQYGMYARVGNGVCTRDGLPPMVKKELARLRAVIVETAPDEVISFEAESLGLILPD